MRVWSELVAVQGLWIMVPTGRWQEFGTDGLMDGLMDLVYHIRRQYWEKLSYLVSCFGLWNAVGCNGLRNY